MKKWILFILCFVSFSAKMFACGYYPFGDDIRFSLLKPSYVPVYGMKEFNYSFYKYSDVEIGFDEKRKAEQDENIQAWFTFFNGKFPHLEIYNYIYKSQVKESDKSSTALSFAQILSFPPNKEVYEYITFAQKIAYLNSFANDPWERKVTQDVKERKKQLKVAITKASSCKNEVIKKRYAYLAIRLAFYNNDTKSIQSLFKTYFENQVEKDVIYYWALHFDLYTMNSSARKNVEIARVFLNSQEKRFAVELMYDNEISKEEVMNACKTVDERYAVTFYLASKKLDRSINDLKNFSKFSKDENLMLFLILRETNKLEDWILTPHYAEFSPMTSQDSWDDSVYFQLRGRIQTDRKYANELADWAGTISFKDEQKAAWLKTIQAYLYFLGNDHTKYANSKTHLKTSTKDANLERFNGMLLALMHLNEASSPNLENTDVQQTILSEHKLGNNRFLFALGRELEIKNQFTDAAYIYSKLNANDNWENFVLWRSNKLHHTLYDDYYYEYFFYLDAAYNPVQITALISDSDKNSSSEFDNWKKMGVRKDKSRLTDLLGTKYLRQNKLDMAFSTLQKVNDSIWKSKNYHYTEYLNSNPFYADFYSEHNKTAGDTIRYTKPEIVKKLIDYLAKIEETPEGNKKAYYCFQVANCYYNMTQYGNSWMMRRYFWTRNATRTKLEDDSEYFNCNYAKRYYVMASAASKDEKVKALALRMAGKCEYFKLIEEHSDAVYDENFAQKLTEANRYYNTLKKDFPNHYEPLMSNCQTFFEYNKLLK